MLITKTISVKGSRVALRVMREKNRKTKQKKDAAKKGDKRKIS